MSCDSTRCFLTAGLLRLRGTILKVTLLLNEGGGRAHVQIGVVEALLQGFGFPQLRTSGLGEVSAGDTRVIRISEQCARADR